MSELRDKVVVITGGSRGLGLAMSEGFAAEGAHVIVASRKLAGCQEVARRLTEEHGVECLPYEINVSDWSQCDGLVEFAYDTFGRVDVLINNAGLSPLYESLDEVSEELFDKTIAINLKGPFRLTAAIGTRMARGDGGAIINIGSVGAIRPEPHALPYAAAKAGLHVLTEGFAQAFGPRVRVNTIQAGPFLTDISRHWTDEMKGIISSHVALQRSAEPDEIVRSAIFFATSASSFSTGALLRVDGGWR